MSHILGMNVDRSYKLCLTPGKPFHFAVQKTENGASLGTNLQVYLSEYGGRMAAEAST